MQLIKKSIAPLLTGVIVLNLSSCTTTPTNRKTDNAVNPTTISNTAASTTTTTTSKNTITVTIYQPDNQCQELVPKKVAVSDKNSVAAAVGKVLEERDTADFNLAGYRVKVNQKSGVATVDLRLAPNQERKFASLSTCEQFALFGSLRKTLISNQAWKIKDVRFTDQGQEIYL